MLTVWEPPPPILTSTLALISVALLTVCSNTFSSVAQISFSRITTYLEFLNLLFLFSFLLSIFLRWHYRGSSKPKVEPPLLDPYTIAFIEKGEKRAIHAAITRLTHEHCLVFDPKGHISALNSLPETAYDLEKTIYEIISTSGENTTLATLVPQLQQTFQDLQEKLTHYGFLVPQERDTGGRIVPFLLMAVPSILGAIKTQSAFSLEKPFFLLTLFTAFSSISAFFFLKPLRKSRYGARYINLLKKGYASLKTDPFETFVEPQTLPLAFALFGSEILIDTPLTWLEEILGPS